LLAPRARWRGATARGEAGEPVFRSATSRIDFASRLVKRAGQTIRRHRIGTGC